MSRQFILASLVLVVATFSLLAHWTSTRIREAVEQDVGARASLYLGSLLSPHLDEIAGGAELPRATAEAFDQELDRAFERLGIREMKLWSPSGRILFGSDPRVQGRTFPVEGGLAAALAGEISVEADDEFHGQGLFGEPIFDPMLFEVYVPVRDRARGHVIAVAELYQDAAPMMSALEWTRLQTWGLVGGLAACLVAALYQVVNRGSSLIATQRIELHEGQRALARLSDHVEHLRRRIEQSPTGGHDGEAHLRRIGSDIHDGIGQLLTIALLRLEQLFPDGGVDNKDYQAVRAILDDAMTEVREISAGLVLPHVTNLGLAEAIATFVLKHRHRTSTEVALAIAEDIVEPSHSVKLAICRFVQEALNNSFKHAGGVGQSVSVEWRRPFIKVEVADRGPGVRAEPADRGRQPLGLIGLRDRVESLGGEFVLSHVAGRGTVLVAHFPQSA